MEKLSKKNLNGVHGGVETSDYVGIVCPLCKSTQTYKVMDDGHWGSIVPIFITKNKEPQFFDKGFEDKGYHYFCSECNTEFDKKS